MSDLSSASTNEQEVSERPRWFPTSVASRCEKVPAEAREARVLQLGEAVEVVGEAGQMFCRAARARRAAVEA